MRVRACDRPTKSFEWNRDVCLPDTGRETSMYIDHKWISLTGRNECDYRLLFDGEWNHNRHLCITQKWYVKKVKATKVWVLRDASTLSHNSILLKKQNKNSPDFCYRLKKMLALKFIAHTLTQRKKKLCIFSLQKLNTIEPCYDSY